jgi:hypothetical protein
VAASAADFWPYVAYEAADEDLDRFVELSRLSYGLAQQLLFATPKASLPPLEITPPPFDEVSFGEQHVERDEVELDPGLHRPPGGERRGQAPAQDLTHRAAGPGSLTVGGTSLLRG